MIDPSGVVVIDASALVALLADAGPAGDWVTQTIAGSSLAAPCLAVFEAANIFRRHAAAGLLDRTAAALAHADLVALPIELWPYSALADRAWELRENHTAYDGSYVALAEMLDCPLVTLDSRLARSRVARCRVLAWTEPRASRESAGPSDRRRSRS